MKTNQTTKTDTTTQRGQDASTKESKQEQPSVLHRIFTVVGGILCAILLPILVINVTLIVKSYINKDAVPSIGGRFPLIVLTDSMYPEIQGGDLIICRAADPQSIQVGDIISFFDPEGSGTSVVTHRVTELAQTEEGEPAFRTQGDANTAEDQVLVPYENLVGIYTTRIAGLGNVAMFMQTTPGFVVCVVLPMVLLVGYDLLRSRAAERARKQETDALMAELDQLRSAQGAQKQDDEG